MRVSGLDRHGMEAVVLCGTIQAEVTLVPCEYRPRVWYVLGCMAAYSCWRGGCNNAGEQRERRSR